MRKRETAPETADARDAVPQRFNSDFNRSNFLVPDTNVSNIRIVNNAPVPGGSYGRISGTYPARQIQFALKLIF
jgi:hypothetical protein